MTLKNCVIGCLLFVLFPTIGNGQVDTLQPLASFERKDQLLAIDRLQQLYFINDQQAVTKTDASGQVLFEYNNFRLGDLAYLDVTDPFGALAFYKDFGTIILLDRTLNPLTELNLGELGYFSIDLVATSRDNQIWLYDQQDFKLKKVNQQGQLLSESQDLSLTFPKGINGRSLKAIGNQVFLQDDAYGLLVFNQFGQFIRQIPLQGLAVPDTLKSSAGWQRIQPIVLMEVLEPYLIMKIDQRVMIYEPNLARAELLFKAKKSGTNLLLVRNWLVEQEQGFVKIYQLGE